MNEQEYNKVLDKLNTVLNKIDKGIDTEETDRDIALELQWKIIIDIQNKIITNLIAREMETVAECIKILATAAKVIESFY